MQKDQLKDFFDFFPVLGTEREPERERKIDKKRITGSLKCCKLQGSAPENDTNKGPPTWSSARVWDFRYLFNYTSATIKTFHFFAGWSFANRKRCACAAERTPRHKTWCKSTKSGPKKKRAFRVGKNTFSIEKKMSIERLGVRCRRQGDPVRSTGGFFVFFPNRRRLGVPIS